MKLAHAFSVVVLLVLAPDVAHAQSNNTGVASQLFDTGRDLMRRGEFAAACPKLAESARLDPHVGTLARLAECEEKVGHLAAARGHWNDAVDLARAQKDNRLPHVQQELARVEAVVPRLMLVAAESPPSGFAVRIDDLSVGAEAVGVPLPVDPGHHTLEVTAPARKPWATTFDTKADGATTKIDIPVLAPARTASTATVPISAPALAAPPPRRDEGHRPLAPFGLVAAGAGIAVVGAGIGLGIVAMSFRDQALAEGCQDGGICLQGPASADYGTARTLADWSTVSFVTGSVLVAAGVALFVLAPRVVERRVAIRPTLGGLEVTW